MSHRFRRKVRVRYDCFSCRKEILTVEERGIQKATLGTSYKARKLMDIENGKYRASENYALFSTPDNQAYLFCTSCQKKVLVCACCKSRNKPVTEFEVNANYCACFRHPELPDERFPVTCVTPATTDYKFVCRECLVWFFEKDGIEMNKVKKYSVPHFEETDLTALSDDCFGYILSFLKFPNFIFPISLVCKKWGNFVFSSDFTFVEQISIEFSKKMKLMAGHALAGVKMNLFDKYVNDFCRMMNRFPNFKKFTGVQEVHLDGEASRDNLLRVLNMIPDDCYSFAQRGFMPMHGDTCETAPEWSEISDFLRDKLKLKSSIRSCAVNIDMLPHLLKDSWPEVRKLFIYQTEHRLNRILLRLNTLRSDNEIIDLDLVKHFPRLQILKIGRLYHYAPRIAVTGDDHGCLREVHVCTSGRVTIETTFPNIRKCTSGYVPRACWNSSLTEINLSVNRETIMKWNHKKFQNLKVVELTVMSLENLVSLCSVLGSRLESIKMKGISYPVNKPESEVIPSSKKIGSVVCPKLKNFAIKNGDWYGEKSIERIRVVGELIEKTFVNLEHLTLVFTKEVEDKLSAKELQFLSRKKLISLNLSLYDKIGDMKTLRSIFGSLQVENLTLKIMYGYLYDHSKKRVKVQFRDILVPVLKNMNIRELITDLPFPKLSWKDEKGIMDRVVKRSENNRLTFLALMIDYSNNKKDRGRENEFILKKMNVKKLVRGGALEKGQSGYLKTRNKLDLTTHFS